MEKAFSAHPLWAGASQDELDSAVEVGYSSTCAEISDTLRAVGLCHFGLHKDPSFVAYNLTDTVLILQYSSECRNKRLQGLEKYLMTKLHDRTFSVDPSDAERDRVLSTRMDALQFVTPEHLEMAGDWTHDGAMHLAVKELGKMNAYKVSSE